jgi:hypothetical protein
MSCIQTGFRISEKLSKDIEDIAKECDISKNAAMKMLVALGIKVYLATPQAISDHSPSQNARLLAPPHIQFQH